MFTNTRWIEAEQQVSSNIPTPEAGLQKFLAYKVVWFGRRQVRTCVSALCYRHRQKADLEKFSQIGNLVPVYCGEFITRLIRQRYMSPTPAFSVRKLLVANQHNLVQVNITRQPAFRSEQSTKMIMMVLPWTAAPLQINVCRLLTSLYQETWTSWPSPKPGLVMTTINRFCMIWCHLGTKYYKFHDPQVAEVEVLRCFSKAIWKWRV